MAAADSDQLEEGVTLVQRGADAWLPRSQGVDELRSIVARMVAGKPPLPTAAVLARITESIRDTAHEPPRMSGRLSSREMQVLSCLTAGQTRAEIAQTLEISTETVRTHVQHILRKLGVHAVQDAIVIALREEAPAGAS